MTAQDTINFLSNLAEVINHNGGYGEALKTAIRAVEELEKYRVLEERLDGISVGHLVNAFIERCETATNEGYERGRILTNEDADKWDAYKTLGPVEELAEMKEQLNAAKEDIRKLLCGEYGSSCQFCAHDGNEDAKCCNMKGSGSWCRKNAAWKIHGLE